MQNATRNQVLDAVARWNDRKAQQALAGRKNRDTTRFTQNAERCRWQMKPELPNEG